MPWYLYILECAGGRLYTGISTDVARRYAEHATGKGARFTRAHPPERLLLTVEFASRSDALKAEWAVKQMRSDAKRAWCARHADTLSQPLPAESP
ncbi:GIY-YIG nuclease family protein [Crenobacter cavernae]|uniref:GIY-YIG nuclease family protein n=1 Tax=Crenobacter cavernae TaxID=2290923 RepID=A0A345Y4D5_9NEIS|nr:GIY-YIG nuclease family protein [Crenobacter cavernae]AXK38787.1 GIY-YIG nuclease family protein [Crenobacter cavernae]